MTPSLVAGRVRIRAPRTADAEQLGLLNRQLGYATETEELVARIDRLSELDGHFVAGAEGDGKVVGWVQAEHRFSMEAGDKAELVGLIVGAADRRHARRSDDRALLGAQCVRGSRSLGLAAFRCPNLHPAARREERQRLRAGLHPLSPAGHGSSQV